MVEHKFRVGQLVEARTNLSDSMLPGPYEVTRLLPPTGMTLQYRVKSLKSGQERVVREDVLFRNSQ